MAVKKTNPLGPVVAQVQGLRIRQIVAPKDGNHYGIYAGKKLYKAYFDLEVAKKEAERALSTKPSHHPFAKAYQEWRKKK